MITYIFALIYYSIVVSINKIRLVDIVIITLISLLAVLEYSMYLLVFNDVLIWLVIVSVVDIILLTVFCFGYNKDKALLVICIISILCTMWNILSYIDIRYYVPLINTIITNNYIYGTLLFINVENKYINVALKLLLIGASFI